MYRTFTIVTATTVFLGLVFAGAFASHAHAGPLGGKNPHPRPAGDYVPNPARAIEIGGFILGQVIPIPGPLVNGLWSKANGLDMTGRYNLAVEASTDLSLNRK